MVFFLGFAEKVWSPSRPFANSGPFKVSCYFIPCLKRMGFVLYIKNSVGFVVEIRMFFFCEMVSHCVFVIIEMRIRVC